MNHKQTAAVDNLTFMVLLVLYFKLPETSTDHQCVGGPENPSHPGSGGTGSSPEAGLGEPSCLRGPASETGPYLGVGVHECSWTIILKTL